VKSLAKSLPLVPLSAGGLLATSMLAAAAGAATSTSAPPPPSVFLPPAGQTVQYRYSDAVTTAKGTKSEAAILTLTSAPGNRVHVTIAADGKEPRSLDFHVDSSGALQPAAALESAVSSSSTPGSRQQLEQRAAAEELIHRLSLAARIGADTSFPIQLNVPGAGNPVTPTLFSTPGEPDTFNADATATTSVDQPGRRRLLLPIGVGLVAGTFAGTTGRLVGVIAGVGGSVIAGYHPPATPADVTLHITGHLTDGHLRTLWADQENVVYARQKTQTVSDIWSFQKIET